MRLADELLIGNDLNQTQASSLFETLLNTSGLDSNIKKLLLVTLQKKGITHEELAGAVRYVRRLDGNPLQTQKLPHLIDGCGTGGDGKKTFNISTVASLVAASAGAFVAKHGNRSITSHCGSSDLMESFGIKINSTPRQTIRALKETRFGYFHAPLYHPAFKSIQSLRIDLAKKRIKTIFNIMGPLLNPLRVKRQLIGVYQNQLVKVIAHTVRDLGTEHTIVFCTEGGFDEVIPGKRINALEIKGRQINPITLRFSLKKPALQELKGGSKLKNRKIALNVLSGKDSSARHDVVIANAGLMLYVSGKVNTIPGGVVLAEKAIRQKMGILLLKQLLQLSYDFK